MVLAHEKTLEVNAGLARLVERAEADALDDLIQRKRRLVPRVDDARGIATELEDDLLLAAARLHVPAHGGRAREREKLETLVAHEDVADLAVGVRVRIRVSVRVRIRVRVRVIVIVRVRVRVRVRVSVRVRV